ncbi:hypothetical protein BSLG_001514 [Batrachochytrium salamandrivorans]|nr:hypothetical protein BSLG_001514 [Batrachochytrium salamandrivorans]
MYTLLSGLYRKYTQREEFFVIILGLDNAGKTTLLERIKSIFNGVPGLRPESIAPTVGLNIGKVNVKNITLNFWDLGGQRELQSIWEKYYTECHAIVFVVDSTDRARIEEVKATMERVMQNEIIEVLEARDSKALAISALNGILFADLVDPNVVCDSGGIEAALENQLTGCTHGFS